MSKPRLLGVSSVSYSTVIEARTLIPLSYFARCWLRPQTVLPEALADKLSAVTSRLQFLSASLPPHAQFLSSALPALLTALPRLFTPSYPQVLTHGDLSLTNILVSPRCLAIRGIVDWSLGEILPFGLELDILFLTTGFMDLEGWHNYEYGLRMREAFWENFFSVFARMGWDDAKRALIRREAEAAAKIGAVLRYAFKRNADGSASRELADEGSTGWKYLKAWFGDGCVVEPAQ